MIYIGVDPGLTGGIATLSKYGDGPTAGDFADSVDMPTIEYSKTGAVKRALDGNGLYRIIGPRQPRETRLFIERVNAFPGQGVSSMFSLGMSYWGVVCAANALGIPVELVNPAAWKKHFGLGADKDQARGLASRLYPSVDLSKKKDHGRAEALLIARYGMEKSTGKTI